MPPDRLLRWVATAEIAVLAAALCVIFGHALWSWRSRRHRATLLAGAHALLSQFLQRTDAAPVDPTFLRRLPLALRIRLFTDTAVSLSGGAAARLTALASAAGVIPLAERWCRSRWWWRRLHGARLLTILGGGDAFVPPLLHDPSASVRAQAAEWAAGHPTPAVIGGLLDALAGGGRLFRFAAQDALGRIGPEAIEPMRAYLVAHTGAQVEPVLEVAIGLADPRLLAPALRFAEDGSDPMRALAAALLGALGGEQAVGALERLLQDPSAEVRANSVRALGHLGEWPAAPRIALLLRDQSWDVRREAGLTLRTLGAPGLLYLRRALTDPDPFAADMAKQVLDQPYASEPWSLT